MTVIRRTEPAVEPISLDEAKTHLRVDSDDEDYLIKVLISAARDTAEQYCERIFCSAQFALLLSSFSSTITTPLGATEIVSVGYVDSASVNQIVDAADYVFDADRRTLKPVSSWPSGSNLTIEYMAGPDPADSPPRLPPPSVIAAMMLILGDLYDNREGSFVAVTRIDNPAVKRLLDPYRVNLGV